MLVDALIDACFDTLKLFPFLFATYLFMEWLEHGAGSRFEAAVARGGRIGPVIGALLGVVPQCGFSGAAATLYAGRVVTLGTLIAVFVATSDEMLPIMISEAINPLLIAKVLAIKVAAAIVCGLVIDAILQRMGRLHEGLGSRKRHAGHSGHDICALCEEEGCKCGHDHETCSHCGRSLRVLDDAACNSACEPGHGGGHGHSHEHGQGRVSFGTITIAALRHALNISVFILVITLIINLLAEMGLQEALASMADAPFAGVVVAGVLGCIPNCAISVGVTQLYLEGVLSGGTLIAGLSVNAGVGLLVLFRTNRDFNENIRVLLVMLAIGVVAGGIVEVTGLL